MKLNYKNTRTITTADLFDAADPPLIFEVRTRASSEWARLHKDFEENGADDAALARHLISLIFLTVSDGEDGSEIYPIDTIETVQSLQDAIEDNNPGDGDNFVCTIAWAFGINYYSFLEGRLARSLKRSKQLNDNGLVKTPA